MRVKNSLLVSATITSALLGSGVAPAGAVPKGVAMNAEDEMKALDGRFVLRFFDAVSGKPVSDASVTFEDETLRTDSEGGVTFDLPPDLGPGDADFKVQFAKKGYVRASLPVRFTSGAIFFNRFSVSPSLPPGRLRIVLDWGDRPADLDAHFVKTGAWHISFRDMRKYEDLAWLDRDAMRGYGPETITLTQPDENAVYRYFVHDFSHVAQPASDALAESRAQVRVYSDAGLVRSFSVPSGNKGTKWEVFKIVQGELVAP